MGGVKIHVEMTTHFIFLRSSLGAGESLIFFLFGSNNDGFDTRMVLKNRL